MDNVTVQIRGTDKEGLLDLSVLDRAMRGPPESLKVNDKRSADLSKWRSIVIFIEREDPSVCVDGRN